MIACPVLSPILLKRAMPLPAAILCPSPLLLPGDRLLLGALGLLLSLLLRVLLRLRLRPLRLGLLRPLLRLLSGLRVRLLRLRLRPLRLRLLGPLLRLLSRLRVLLLCGWRAPFFFLLGGYNRPEKQEQGGGAGNSNELHDNPLPFSSQSGMHADGQSALTMLQHLGCFRLGFGPVHRPVRVVGRSVERGQL